MNLKLIFINPTTRDHDKTNEKNIFAGAAILKMMLRMDVICPFRASAWRVNGISDGNPFGSDDGEAS